MKSLRGCVSLAAAALLAAIPALAQDRLFVTTTSTNSVAGYAIDSGSGTLTAGPVTNLGATPAALGSCPGKPFVFVVAGNGSTHELRSYSVLPDGTLTQNGTAAALGAATASENLAADPQCRFIYAISNSRPSLKSVAVDANGLLGSAVSESAVIGSPHVAAVSPNGAYLHVLAPGLGFSGAIASYPITSVTGTLGARAQNRAVFNIGAAAELAFTDNGANVVFSYGLASPNNSMWRYPMNADGTFNTGSFSTINAGVQPTSLAAHPSAAYVYVADAGNTISPAAVRGYTASLGGAPVGVGSVSAAATDLVAFASGANAYLYAATSNAIDTFPILAGGALGTPSTRSLAGASNLAIVTGNVTPGALDVTVVIDKGAGTSCVNPKANGLLPAIIFGNAQVAASGIDIATLSLAGSSPKRCTLGDLNADGLADLRCTFQASEITYPSEFVDCGSLPLTGKLLTGADIAGDAQVCLKKGATCSL